MNTSNSKCSKTNSSKVKSDTPSADSIKISYKKKSAFKNNNVSDKNNKNPTWSHTTSKPYSLKDKENDNSLNSKKNRLNKNSNNDNICANYKKNKRKNKNNNTTKSSTTEINSKPKRIMSTVSITIILPKNNKNCKTSTKPEPCSLRRKRKNKGLTTKKRIMKLSKWEWGDKMKKSWGKSLIKSSPWELFCRPKCKRRTEKSSRREKTSWVFKAKWKTIKLTLTNTNRCKKRERNNCKEDTITNFPLKFMLKTG